MQIDFNKSFHSQLEEDARLQIFVDNLATIERHNEMFNTGNATFRMGINQFADMTIEEFTFLNEVVNESKVIPDDFSFNPTTFTASDDFEAPESFDWRDCGALPRVRDQMGCGSCYAIATVAAVESQIFIKTNKLSELSVQEIVDCAGDNQTTGCDGGFELSVFEYVHEHGELSLSSDYNYEGAQGVCKSEELPKVSINLTSYVELEPCDEELLKIAIAQVGPIVVSLDINHESFMRYSSGTYFEPDCTRHTNHVVLLVGYGSENAEDFWVIQNSFGVKWGEEGFMKLARNRDSHCGVAIEAMYPIIHSLIH